MHHATTAAPTVWCAEIAGIVREACTRIGMGVGLGVPSAMAMGTRGCRVASVAALMRSSSVLLVVIDCPQERGYVSYACGCDA